jgi:hypothetical protein
MSNTPQNPAKKPQDDRYSNQSKQGVNPNQKDQANNNDRNAALQKDGNKAADANKAGGIKNDPQSSDTRREREEEDRPRANKAGNK